MFVGTNLASTIEAAEARLSASIARAYDATGQPGVYVEHIGNGVAVYTGPSSPINKMIGIGFDGPVDDGVFAGVEARFRARDAALQAEVATLATAEIAATLTRRGYVLQGFENVLGCETSGADSLVPPGIDVGCLPPGLGRQWLDIAITGFMHPDTQGVIPEPLPPRDVLERALEVFADVPGSCTTSRPSTVRPRASPRCGWTARSRSCVVRRRCRHSDAEASRRRCCGRVSPTHAVQGPVSQS